MIKIFVDANIFFAAAKSPRGGSALILELAKKKRIKIVTVNYVLREAEKNIKNKLDIRFLLAHYQNVLEINPEIQSLDAITLKNVGLFIDVLPIKDIPILLGALLSGAGILLTLDKKDFLENKKLGKLKLPLKIINPEIFIKKHL